MNIVPFPRATQKEIIESQKQFFEMKDEKFHILENKLFRKDLDAILQMIKNSPRKSRNRSLAITHLEDTIMRLGMDLKDLNEPDPYPESRNPENTVVEPTADGLKL